MTKPLPFTTHSLARAIKGVERAGLYVVGVKADGTLIVASEPIEASSLVPKIEQPSPRKFGERLGGQGAA